VKAFVRVVGTLGAVMGVGAVAAGWVFAGLPNDAEDAVDCVLTHLVAAGGVAIGVFAWRVKL
jgi:hypothetical protein